MVDNICTLAFLLSTDQGYSEGTTKQCRETNCVLQVYRERNTEIEYRHLENFIAVWNCLGEENYPRAGPGQEASEDGELLTIS